MNEPSEEQAQETRARAEHCLLILLILRRQLAARKERREEFYFRGAEAWPELLHVEPDEAEHQN
jgi:hypothetical protein